MLSYTDTAPGWLAGPLAILLLAVVTLPASGAEPLQRHDTGGTDYEAVTATIDVMRASGASQAAIDRELERAYGWVAVGQPSGEAATTVIGASTMASENSDVTLSTPQVYFNTSAGRYEASASFQWNVCGREKCYMDDYSGRNVGGYDGFGIRFGRLVSRRNHVMTVSTEDNCRQTYPIAADAGDDGAVFRNQDRFLDVCGTSDYNWDRGTVVFSFLLRPGCPKGEYKIDSKLAHTWSSSGVSAISVSTSGISVSFSSSDHHWSGVSAPRTWKPCGA